jgi:molecular chaperone DnaJ
VAVDYYSILGVSKAASADEIRKAYRKLARELHPDVNPDPAMQEKFKEVTTAYEVLSDPEKRQMFDMGGDPMGNGGGGFGFNAEGFDFGDVFNTFFGGGGQRGPIPRIRRGQDALIRIEVDLEEVLHGVKREITIDTAIVCPICTGKGTAKDSEITTCQVCKGRGETQTVTKSFLGQVMTSRRCNSCGGFGTVIPHPCHECGSEGRVRTRENISFDIPPGVETGNRIQLNGKGEVGFGGGPAGDLYVEILEKQHPVFHRRGHNLHCSLQVPMTAAALGATVKLETIDGPVDVVIEPGTQSGAVIKRKHEGVPHLRSTARGDLNIHISVQTPTRVDRKQQELLEQLAKLRGEENPTGEVMQEQPGFFSRIKDAFGGR